MTDAEVEALYADAQKKLRTLHRTLSWAHMSKECGICAATLKAFAHNETARPQFRTVVLLADYAGFCVAVQDVRRNLPDSKTILKLRRVK